MARVSVYGDATRLGLAARAPLRLSVVSAPSSEPVTVTGVKEHARITTSADDDYVSSLIVLAREYAESYQRRALITQALSIKLHDFPWGWNSIVLPRPPLQSVDSITYLDSSGATVTLSAATYRVMTENDPGEIVLASGQEWPTVSDNDNAVTINFTAGYGSAGNVPQMTKHAIMMLCRAWYDHRDAMTDQTAGNVRALGPPAGVDRLLDFARLELV